MKQQNFLIINKSNGYRMIYLCSLKFQGFYKSCNTGKNIFMRLDYYFYH